MPRPKNNSLLALYKCNDLNQIVCYNEKCDGKVLYKHSANLERHLKLLHPSIYCSYMQKKKILKFPRKLNFEKRLIDLVRDYPILWNKFDEDRFNEDLTSKTWKEIGRKIEKSPKRCKMKWVLLIEKFKSELIQVPQPLPDTKTVKGSTCNWKSNWKYFSELLFLRDQIDLTKRDVSIPPEQIEKNNIAYIKEESSQSFQLYNETLEDSCQFEYGEGSMIQDDKEESRLLGEIEESRLQDDREASGPPVDISETSKEQNDTQISINQCNMRPPALNETDDEDDYEYFVKKHKTMKHKTKEMLNGENDSMNVQDSDRLFLLSLLPFLKAIPDSKRLFVRHRMQGVLLEEQQKS